MTTLASVFELSAALVLLLAYALGSIVIVVTAGALWIRFDQARLRRRRAARVGELEFLPSCRRHLETAAAGPVGAPAAVHTPSPRLKGEHSTWRPEQ